MKLLEELGYDINLAKTTSESEFEESICLKGPNNDLKLDRQTTSNINEAEGIQSFDKRNSAKKEEKEIEQGEIPNNEGNKNIIKNV